MSTRESILAILKDVPEPRVEKIGHLWQIGFAWVAGARADGDGLARDLLGKYRLEGGYVPGADIPPEPVRTPDPEPQAVDIPAFLVEPPDGEVEKFKAKVAELEAKLAEKDAVIREAENTPPADVTETLKEVGLYGGTIEQIDSEMTVLYARYMGYAQYASKNTVYAGQGEVYWTRKAERYLRVRDWNRGRMAEKI